MYKTNKNQNTVRMDKTNKNQDTVRMDKNQNTVRMNKNQKQSEWTRTTITSLAIWTGGSTFNCGSAYKNNVLYLHDMNTNSDIVSTLSIHGQHFGEHT